MNKKAQALFAGIILFIVFFIVFFLVLSPWLATIGKILVETNNMGGIEGFVMGNLNLVVFIVAILAMLGFMTIFGGSR